MLNRNKGFILIEIPMVIAILCILLLISFKCYEQAKKALVYREEIRKETIIFKSVKKELLYNSEFDKLQELFKNKEALYINLENIDLNRIISNNITDLLDNEILNNNKYIKIQKLDSEKVLKLKLEEKNNKIDSKMLNEEVYISRNIR
jgi:Tfp pilus assembly protein PilE